MRLHGSCEISRVAPSVPCNQPERQIPKPSLPFVCSLHNTLRHEVSHGFDDEGRKYDGGGNLVDWWEQDAITRFEDLAQCYVDQVRLLPLCALCMSNVLLRCEPLPRLLSPLI